MSKTISHQNPKTNTTSQLELLTILILAAWPVSVLIYHTSTG
jgi:hypothetical protein